MKITHLFLIVLFLISLVLTENATPFELSAAEKGLVLETVEQIVTIQKPNEIQKLFTLKIKNNKKETKNNFYFFIPEFHYPYVASFRMHQLLDKTPEVVFFNPSSFQGRTKDGSYVYSIPLNPPLLGEETRAITISYVLMNIYSVNDKIDDSLKFLRPIPRKIEQNQPQILEFSDFVYFSSIYTPYHLKTQTYRVFYSGDVRIIDYSRINQFPREQSSGQQKQQSLDYGPFYEVENNERLNKISIKFQNNLPNLCASELDKLIEVSHWGNVAIEETYTVNHLGAKLKTGFSRFDYAKQGQPQLSAPSSVRDLVGELPLNAGDVYFRDRIGNISSSEMQIQMNPETRKNSLFVRFSQRFPLFGGWKTQFYVGWNIPLTSEIFRFDAKTKRYILRTRFTTVFPLLTVKDLNVRVVLPEGAKNLNYRFIARESDSMKLSGFTMDSVKLESVKTYLDTFGRPVLVMKKQNVDTSVGKFKIGNYAGEKENEIILEVSYEFPTYFLFHEPLLVIGGLFCLCLCIIAFLRIEFTISKTQPEILQEYKEKAKSALEDYASIAISEKQEKLFNILENELDNLETEAEINDFLNKKFKELQELKEKYDSFVKSNVISKLELNNDWVLTKRKQVEEIEKKQKERFDLIVDIFNLKKESANKNKKQIEQKEEKYLEISEDVNELAKSFDF